MDRYVVIGNPVSHSLSPEIHARFARQTGEALQYARLEAPLDGFDATATRFFAEGGRGANVTLPFKLDAFRFAHSASDRATLAGAANFLARRGDAIVADNTDGAGLVADLVRNLGLQLRGARILLIGAGGAARGVIAPLLALAPGTLVIANRTLARARELAAVFAGRGPIEAMALDALQHESHAVVINATSSSTHGERLEIDDAVFANAGFAYDMAYGAKALPFLGRARAAGIEACDGLGMLVEQAAESFELWRGVRPATRPVLEALRAAAA